MSLKKDTQKSAATNKQSQAFTDEERAAMKARPRS